MSRYLLSLKIGGEAGFGIKSAGLTIAKTMSRAGYEVFGYVEYPSLIRGGHNVYQVTVGDDVIRSTAQNVDVLVALNKETFGFHGKELNHGAVIIYDRDEFKISLTNRHRGNNVKLVHVPLAAITRQVGGLKVMRNTISLGAIHAIVDLPLSLLASVIKKTLGHKAHILETNLAAARRGYEYVRKNYADLDFKVKLEVRPRNERLLLSGNEAVGLGALAGGLQFYAGYPMTPSSSLLHYLAGKAQSQRLIVKHAEDEISVINMALGASHAGARAMIGTSGGGFSLMVEALGLAGITETPLVILESQRPGPATGLPTWTEQGDLRFVMHASQGEFPRIIVAPGDHEECFYLTAAALNWADQYQTPVIILSDKFLSESDRTVEPFDVARVYVDRGHARLPDAWVRGRKSYKRYRVTASGVSPRSVPGQKGGIYLANSDEHDEFGFSSEDAAQRTAQVQKRAAKLRHAAQHIHGATLYGNPRARTTIVSWGSNKGPVLDALRWLPGRMQKKVNFLHLFVVSPFPTDYVSPVLRRAKKVLLIENNSTAQLGGLIRQYTGYDCDRKMLRYDGRPMYPIDIKERIMDL